MPCHSKGSSHLLYWNRRVGGTVVKPMCLASLQVLSVSPRVCLLSLSRAFSLSLSLSLSLSRSLALALSLSLSLSLALGVFSKTGELCLSSGWFWTQIYNWIQTGTCGVSNVPDDSGSVLKPSIKITALWNICVFTVINVPYVQLQCIYLFLLCLHLFYSIYCTFIIEYCVMTANVRVF